jgi:NADH:ubiquinone oxidoreductase subunit H
MGVISAIFIIFFCGGWGTSFGNKDVYSSTVDVKLYDYGFFFDNFSFFSIFFEVFSMAFKITFFSMFFIFVRAALPRKRFDQLVHLCWKVLFPLSFSIVLLSISLLVTFINFFSFMDSNNWIFFI